MGRSMNWGMGKYRNPTTHLMKEGTDTSYCGLDRDIYMFAYEKEEELEPSRLEFWLNPPNTLKEWRYCLNCGRVYKSQKGEKKNDLLCS